MDIKNADDVQLLVEDMGWRFLPVDEVCGLLEDMNQEELHAARALVNQRVWDETYTDETAAEARWAYTRKASLFTEAIQAWAEAKAND